jgi:hypothetical protein
MSKEQKVTIFNSSIFTILFVVLLTLKLAGNIDWSWWWVTSPLWIPLAIAVLIISLMFMIGVIMLLLKDPNKDTK